jgi:hypothetical protein
VQQGMQFTRFPPTQNIPLYLGFELGRISVSRYYTATPYPCHEKKNVMEIELTIALKAIITESRYNSVVLEFKKSRM